MEMAIVFSHFLQPIIGRSWCNHIDDSFNWLLIQFYFRLKSGGTWVSTEDELCNFVCLGYLFFLLRLYNGCLPSCSH